MNDDTRAPAAHRPGGAPAARSPAGRTLLLAEDDHTVRSLLRRYLEAEGHRVIEAAGGGEALRLAREAGPIDGLVTDVLMPEMDGKELARHLRAELPGLRVLYVSASADPELVAGVLPPGQLFLPKPFDRDGLTRAIRELLK